MLTFLVQLGLVAGVIAVVGPSLLQSHRRRVAAVRRDTERGR